MMQPQSAAGQIRRRFGLLQIPLPSFRSCLFFLPNLTIFISIFWQQS